MPTTRISEETHELLHRLSEQEGSSMQEIVAKALEEYRRKRFLEKSNEAYTKLRKTQLWGQEQEEREAWETTLQDGLGEDA